MNVWSFSEIILPFMVILCDVWIQSLASQDSCRHLIYATPVRGFALQGHVIKNLSIGIYASCKHLCTMESHCFSFNLGPPITGRMLCELSDSDVTKHPGDLKPREGFVYRGTENACFSNPCPYNATCLNGFTDEKYFCQCQAGYTGEQCEKENWEKVNSVPVCFGAESNRYGTFVIGENGFIYTFKLVHKTGFLRCHPNLASHWGCDSEAYYGDKKLLTVITYPNKTALPIAEYSRDDVQCGYKYHSYHIDGIGINSPELVFDVLSPPLSVSIGQSFHIWYGEDLHDCGDDNNSGETCADVYAWYTT